MAVRKLAISLESQLADEVQRAAESEAQGNISAWLAEAARQRLQHLAAREALEQYEADAGPITDRELAEARALWPQG